MRVRTDKTERLSATKEVVYKDGERGTALEYGGSIQYP
jgi:hypothetical protein